MPKVHGKDKGVYPNLKPEKQVVEPLGTPVQLHVPTEAKGHSNVQPGIGQGGAGIKRKILQRVPMLQSHGKAGQPKLLPGRKPVIQVAERPVLHIPTVVRHMNQVPGTEHGTARPKHKIIKQD